MSSIGYECYVDHPESDDRRADDFDTWIFWAEKHAPWTGVAIDQQSVILGTARENRLSGSVCDVLDGGGVLTLGETRQVLQHAGEAMSDKVRHVFKRAVARTYGVRVIFTPSPFGGLTASAYLAKSASAPEA